MDTTIRNLDKEAYRSLRAQAVMEGRPVGELITDAIRLYLSRVQPRKHSTLRELRPEPYPAGNEDLSVEIDRVVYGDERR